MSRQHVAVIRRFEPVRCQPSEIGEVDRHRRVVSCHCQLEADLSPVAFLGFQVPLAFLAPPEPNRPERNDRLSGLVERHGFPGGVVGLTEIVGEILGAQQAFRHVSVALAYQADQHRKIRVTSRVIVEIRNGPVQIVFPQDHVADSQCQCGIGALFRMQPQIGEFGGLGVVRGHDDTLCSFVTDLGIKMCVGGARLRHVGAPDHEIAGVVPIGAFRHVGLLAPGHWASGGQIAIPVVEAHADAAE